jgi:hypothetical protein
MVEAQWGQAGDVFITNVVSAGAELVQRRIRIDAPFPQDDIEVGAEEGAIAMLLDAEGFFPSPARLPPLWVDSGPTGLAAWASLQCESNFRFRCYRTPYFHTVMFAYLHMIIC